MTFSGLIAVYLFLGGTSAGAYAVLAVLDVASNMSTRAACAVGPKSRGHPRRVRGYGIHGNAAEKRCRCEILADDVASGAIRSVCAFVRLCGDNACFMLM